ncbi:hypothetical protein [Tolypothrix sp. VBCCA 56010]|uniref:hypothetical protein n=1 Tax=Tolypothrix sp. VBCCA 56010 TaxID=3137731 RepID=UPI003D7E351D
MGQWAWKESYLFSDERTISSLIPNSQCPIPNAQCPITHCQCPISNCLRDC